MMMKIKTPAKINLTLDVLKKSTIGYHHVATILQEIPLYDELIFRKIKETKIIFKCTNPDLPTDGKNLVLKAVHVMRKYQMRKNLRTQGKQYGLEIILKKNIPVGVGFGGGSSDAAATLKALNQIWNMNLSSRKLQQLGAKIGMDVPFFITGGTAYGIHYGEKIQQLTHLKIPPFLIIISKKMSKMSTAEQYKKLEKYPHGHEYSLTKKMKNHLMEKSQDRENKGDVAKLYHNDFERLFSRKFASIQRKLYLLGAETVHLTGSGPAIYAFFHNKKNKAQAKSQLQKDKNIWII